MNLEDMLKQQEQRGLKKQKIRARMQSYEDYVRDDLSPRPYNTPNVTDVDGKDGGGSNGIIRDTKGSKPGASIKDTKSPKSDVSIRDTKSPKSDVSIRDTKSPKLDVSIRDTKSPKSDVSIRDTKSPKSDVSIRDTKSPKLDASIRGTKSPKSDVSVVGRPKKNRQYNYVDLSGNSKKIVDEILQLCLVLGCKETIQINKLELSINTGVKLGAIKTTIRRLLEKGVITSYEATKGRNSCWRINLSQRIYEQYVIFKKGIRP